MKVALPIEASRIGIVLAFASAIIVAAPEDSRADIVEKKITSTSGKSATGFVFQGSKNMKRRGKTRSTSSSIVVPPLDLSILGYGAVQPMTSAPVTPAAPSSYDPTGTVKPRFGYGSDYQPGAETGPAPSPVPVVPPVVQNPSPPMTSSPRFLPVPSNREFYPVIRQQSPFSYGYGPFFPPPFQVPCYAPFSWGIPQVNISYRGGRTSTSAWGGFFGTRVFRFGL